METPDVSRRDFLKATAVAASRLVAPVKDFPEPNEYYESLPLEEKLDFVWGVVQIQTEQIQQLKEIAEWAIKRYLEPTPSAPPLVSSNESNV